MPRIELLFLSRDQVASLGAADMGEAIRDIEEVLALRDRGEALTPDKAVMNWGSTPEEEFQLGRINALPGYAGGRFQMAGLKWIGYNPQNSRRGLSDFCAMVVLNDPDTRYPVAVLDGTRISEIRTGAVGGVAAKYLARPEAETVLLIGAGRQNRTQLEAVSLVRRLRQVFVYDIFPEAAQRYAREMGEKLGLRITPVADAKAAALRADIIITATVSREPIVEADWLSPGVLYLQVGGYECTYDALRRADKCVVDTWQGVKHRQMSTISKMYLEGLVDDAVLHGELGEILTGRKPGREDPGEVIYFNSVGMGVEDVAVASRIYRLAKERSVGTPLRFWED